MTLYLLNYKWIGYDNLLLTGVISEGGGWEDIFNYYSSYCSKILFVYISKIELISL